jgi:hypothetical protein
VGHLIREALAEIPYLALGIDGKAKRQARREWQSDDTRVLTVLRLDGVGGVGHDIVYLGLLHTILLLWTVDHR